MDKDFFIVILLITISLVLLFFAFQLIANHNKKKREEKTAFKRPENAVNKCPVCDSGLVDRERIISRVYHNEKDTDQLCNIIGCPHCFPYSEVGVRRKCPVCGKIIPQEGYLIARIFYHKTKKNHVHIIGCTECHKRKK